MNIYFSTYPGTHWTPWVHKNFKFSPTWQGLTWFSLSLSLTVYVCVCARSIPWYEELGAHYSFSQSPSCFHSHTSATTLSPTQMPPLPLELDTFPWGLQCWGVLFTLLGHDIQNWVTHLHRCPLHTAGTFYLIRTLGLNGIVHLLSS